MTNKVLAVVSSFQTADFSIDLTLLETDGLNGSSYNILESFLKFTV